MQQRQFCLLDGTDRHLRVELGFVLEHCGPSFDSLSSFSTFHDVFNWGSFFRVFHKQPQNLAYVLSFACIAIIGVDFGIEGLLLATTRLCF